MSLEDIKRRMEAATPGPWEADMEWDDNTASIGGPDHQRQPFAFLDVDNEADALFIAHSRTDMEKLVKVAEAAKEVSKAIASDGEALPSTWYSLRQALASLDSQEEKS